jgi:glycosyltransferase involved in cell wall biosynthesis
MIERNNIRLSVIVPVGGRHENIAELHAEYSRGLEALRIPYELIYVIDGMHGDVIRDLEPIIARGGSNISLIGLNRAFGESTAIMAGFERASGEIIMTLPAYHQINVDDLGKMLTALERKDVAVGWRWPRAGGAIERFRRNTFHGLVARVTGMKLHDLGCGVRAMKRAVLQELKLYGDQHRLLAVLAERQGFSVTEVELRQSDADRFAGMYRPREYMHLVLDVFTVFFLVRFTKKPLRFFGMIGATMFGIGAATVLYLVFDRLVLGEPLADRPALLISALIVVLGLQLFALGLLAELMIFTHARQLKDYQGAQIIRFPKAELPPPRRDGVEARTEAASGKSATV